MNIHEHQAKELLRDYGVPLSKGVAIFSPDEAEAAARALPGPAFVIDLPDLGGAKKLAAEGVAVNALMGFEGH